MGVTRQYVGECASAKLFDPHPTASRSEAVDLPLSGGGWSLRLAPAAYTGQVIEYLPLAACMCEARPTEQALRNKKTSG